MLGHSCFLLPENIEFTNLKRCFLTELKEENYFRDLGFVVDITKRLNDLNVQLQGLD